MICSSAQRGRMTEIAIPCAMEPWRTGLTANSNGLSSFPQPFLLLLIQMGYQDFSAIRMIRVYPFDLCRGQQGGVYQFLLIWNLHNTRNSSVDEQTNYAWQTNDARFNLHRMRTKMSFIWRPWSQCTGIKKDDASLTRKSAYAGRHDPDSFLEPLLPICRVQRSSCIRTLLMYLILLRNGSK